MKQRYEGMFILKPDLGSRTEEALGQIKEVVTKHGGSVEEIKEWARQRLSYPIKKYREGLYYLGYFAIDASKIAEIRKILSLNESILRSMILRAQGGKEDGESK